MNDTSRPARWGRRFSRLNFRRIAECDLALRWLAAAADERILDVGCGDGYYDWRISRSGARVTGIDVDERRLMFARRRYGGHGVEFLGIDAETAVLEKASFDKALSLCVIEHLRDDERALGNIAAAVKPGGRLVITADSLTNPGVTAAERERHMRRYKVRTFYSADIAAAKLSRAGFVIERTAYVLHSPLSLALVRATWRIDELPAALAFVRPLGYLALGAIHAALGPFRREQPEAAATGLTLVVQARRRAA